MSGRGPGERDRAPERIRWAVDLVAPSPRDPLLEIGCGPGMAAQLVCERLTTGRLLAIDRSDVATKRAIARNRAHIEAGRLEVRTASLDELELEPGRLDAAFSVNVNLFWTRAPDAELEFLSRALRRGGALHVLHGAGPQSAETVIATLSRALKDHGFRQITPRNARAGFGVSAIRA